MLVPVVLYTVGCWVEPVIVLGIPTTQFITVYIPRLFFCGLHPFVVLHWAVDAFIVVVADDLHYFASDSFAVFGAGTQPYWCEFERVVGQKDEMCFIVECLHVCKIAVLFLNLVPGT